MPRTSALLSVGLYVHTYQLNPDNLMAADPLIPILHASGEWCKLRNDEKETAISC
jgi:hypothetical protein